MFPVGPMYDELVDILRAGSDTEMQNRIWRNLNYERFELCREVSWEALRCDPVTLDFTTADSTGLWLPSDLYGIDVVWDDTNGVEFYEIGRAEAQPDEWGYRYWRYLPSRANLFDGSDLILEKDGSSFTSASLTADGTDVEDEYVMFGREPGVYQLTSGTTPFTFEPTYRGPDLMQENFVIRPWQITQKMVIIDPDEDLLYDRSVDVYYWRSPPPLYRKEDIVMLPSLEILKLRVLRSIPEAKARYPVSETMLNTAMRKAVRMNPKFSRFVAPMDKHFKRFDVNTNIFGAR